MPRAKSVKRRVKPARLPHRLLQALLGVALVAAGFTTLMVRLAVMREGYRLSALHAQIAELKENNRSLRLKVAELSSHDRLRALAGPTVHFLGWQPDAVVRDHFRRCRALLFPGEEDFGIVPLEAQACGTPVIAFGRGGATETIIPPCIRREPTGIFFAEQSAACLRASLEGFQKQSADFSPLAARRQALGFNQRRFAEELFAYLDKVLQRPLQRARTAA